MIVTVQAVEQVLPCADGRQWTAEQYQKRDVVLEALGVSAFHKQSTRPR